MIRVEIPYIRDGENPRLRYYGINVFFSKYDYQKLQSNKSLGRLIIFLGLCLVIISSVDISKLSSTLTQSEQSIWPSSGKGIWIGLFIMCIGIFTLIAVKEQSHSAFYIILPYTIIGIILCFFGLLTSIDVLQRYTKDPILSVEANRNKEQGIEFALACLLISIFALSFLFLSCLSCMICWTIPKFCDKFKETNIRRTYPPKEFPGRTTTPIRRRFIVNSTRFRHPRFNTTNTVYRYRL